MNTWNLNIQTTQIGMRLTPDHFLSTSSDQKWLVLRNRFKECPGFLDMFHDTRVNPTDETVQTIQSRFGKEIVAQVELAACLPHMDISCSYILFYICSDGTIVGRSKPDIHEQEEFHSYVRCLKDWLEGFPKN